MIHRHLVLLLTGALHLPIVNAEFLPGPKLKPDDVTVLMAVDGRAAEGLVPFQPGGHGKFHLQGWTRPEQQVAWSLLADRADDYEVRVLIHRKSGPELRLQVTAGGRSLTGALPADARRWQRITLPGTIAVPAGPFDVTLRIESTDAVAFDAEVHAIEWIRPEVRDAQHRRAMAGRADATWFQESRYGIMVHWTSQSMPRQGEPLPYPLAVERFDVETFADQMALTGAGFVVFTTSHAFQFFPAPLTSLDELLPGRTSRRDLVAELINALGRRGLRLMLYHHPGAQDDPAWLAASGFWKTDTAEFFNHWQTIISEAGERYGERLAGWWFDDGATSSYPRQAPWEAMNRAAKAGHPQRLIGFNAWELNNPTPFHDFFTGEGFQEPRGFNELLIRDGNGRYPSGTHEGLQASACLVAEGEWLHRRQGQPLHPPKWTIDELAHLLGEFAAHRNVPVFNLEIHQEGTVSPRTVDVIRRAAEQAFGTQWLGRFPSGEERDDGQNQKDEEQQLRDGGCGAGDPTEAKDQRNQGDDKKDK